MKSPSFQNLISAFALRISDRLSDLTDGLMPRRETGRAIAYIGRAPVCTVRSLSLQLGLSHAATVRLVDRLSEDGMVTRSPSTSDKRAVELSLTDAGMTLYRDMLATASTEIERALATLSDAERTAFASTLAKVLASLDTSPITAGQGCRFCDVDMCQSCPVRAAMTKA